MIHDKAKMRLTSANRLLQNLDQHSHLQPVEVVKCWESTCDVLEQGVIWIWAIKEACSYIDVERQNRAKCVVKAGVGSMLDKAKNGRI